MPVGSARYAWDAESTYVARPPFLDGITRQPVPLRDIDRRARPRCAGRLGDDRSHLTGRFHPSLEPGRCTWLQEHGVGPLEFNSYGARRGQHEVMVRGTFGNIRLRNALAEKEGPYTTPPAVGRADVHLRRRPALRARGRAADGHLWARSTAAGRRATGRPRAPVCSACAPCWPRATSASTAPTWSGWASCRSSSSPARTPSRSA